MRTRTTTAALIAASILATLTACSSDTEPDTAACKAAMAAELKKNTAAGQTAQADDPPAVCTGVEQKTLERIVGELILEEGGKAVDESLDELGEELADAVEDTASPASAECLAWIETELLDSTGSIDAASGVDVCGDLSDEELDQAIEDVTNDLMKEGATPAP
ncbi:hypothetical protein ACIQ1S_03225 [Streptomyces griseus]|uniref:hypothetical protein n=1 Tax=Streptomyces griseus TaxID=1911 RepID=UPI0037F51BA7